MEQYIIYSYVHMIVYVYIIYVKINYEYKFSP